VIRILIVENHQLVSDSLGMLLDGQPDMEVIGYANSVGDASELSASVQPHVVVMDFHLDDGNGRDAAIAIRMTHPAARFLFLSRDVSDEARMAAIQAGASAYLHKSSDSAELIDAIRRVARGESLISPGSIALLLSRNRDRESLRESLSPREREVLQLVADGIPTRQVALKLAISYTTVRTHLRSISAKLGARSMLSAVATARDLELVS
jgi:DNA-binding NarL/FixJ family response regulator